MITAPMPWLMLPVPPVKVGVRVTVAPYNGLVVLAAIMATGAATTVTVVLAVFVVPKPLFTVRV